MRILDLGNDGKAEDITIENNTFITDDPSKLGPLIKMGDNAQLKGLKAAGNESHTPESYAIKIAFQRSVQIQELELAISKLNNEITQTKLLAQLEELKNLPTTTDGQWTFNNVLRKLKEFALDLGAKAVAEIAMKQLGY